MKKYFEMHKGNLHKFWEITLNGGGYTIHHGQIGSIGIEKKALFTSLDEALLDAEILIASKKKEGYKERFPKEFSDQNEMDPACLKGSRCFEFRTGESHKFWEIRVLGSNCITYSGDVGRMGKKIEEKFPSPDEAFLNAEIQIIKKIKEGYLEDKKNVRLKGIYSFAEPFKLLKNSSASFSSSSKDSLNLFLQKAIKLAGNEDLKELAKLLSVPGKIWHLVNTTKDSLSIMRILKDTMRQFLVNDKGFNRKLLCSLGLEAAYLSLQISAKETSFMQKLSLAAENCLLDLLKLFIHHGYVQSALEAFKLIKERAVWKQGALVFLSYYLALNRVNKALHYLFLISSAGDEEALNQAFLLFSRNIESNPENVRYRRVAYFIQKFKKIKVKDWRVCLKAIEMLSYNTSKILILDSAPLWEGLFFLAEAPESDSIKNQGIRSILGALDLCPKNRYPSNLGNSVSRIIKQMRKIESKRQLTELFLKWVSEKKKLKISFSIPSELKEKIEDPIDFFSFHLTLAFYYNTEKMYAEMNDELNFCLSLFFKEKLLLKNKSILTNFINTIISMEDFKGKDRFVTLLIRQCEVLAESIYIDPALESLIPPALKIYPFLEVLNITGFIQKQGYVASCYLEIGKFLYKKGNRNKANDYLKRSVELLKKHSPPEVLRRKLPQILMDTKNIPLFFHYLSSTEKDYNEYFFFLEKNIDIIGLSLMEQHLPALVGRIKKIRNTEIKNSVLEIISRFLIRQKRICTLVDRIIKKGLQAESPYIVILNHFKECQGAVPYLSEVQAKMDLESSHFSRPDAYLTMYFLYKKMNRESHAKQALQKAIEISPIETFKALCREASFPEQDEILISALIYHFSRKFPVKLRARNFPHPVYKIILNMARRSFHEDFFFHGAESILQKLLIPAEKEVLLSSRITNSYSCSNFYSFYSFLLVYLNRGSVDVTPFLMELLEK